MDTGPMTDVDTTREWMREGGTRTVWIDHDGGVDSTCSNLGLSIQHASSAFLYFFDESHSLFLFLVAWPRFLFVDPHPNCFTR